MIDLTRLMEGAMPVFPGDNPPEIQASKSIDEDGHRNSILKTGMHVGTHMDGPAHMLENGRPLYEFDVSRFTGRGVLVDARGKEEISVEEIKGLDIQEGDFVLFYTGWDQHWGDEKYYRDYPVLSEGLAKELVKYRISAVGLDFPSPDKEPYAIHPILLGAEILIIENLMGLSQVTYDVFEVIALPLKVKADSAPVRVVIKEVLK